MTTRYLLDADICIYRLSGRNPGVAARFDRLRPDEAAISAIAYGELLFGVAGSTSPAVSAARLQALTWIAPVAPLPLDAAAHYADIRNRLVAAGRPIGNNDLWIAAHARAAALVLVTNNEREFRRVPELQVENWAEVRAREAAPRYGRRRKPAGLSRDSGTELASVDPVADLRAILGRPALRTARR